MKFLDTLCWQNAEILIIKPIFKCIKHHQVIFTTVTLTGARSSKIEALCYKPEDREFDYR
jgi:hypothetical protein